MSDINTPTPQELDEEQTLTVSYELAMVIPHQSVPVENRELIRRAFEMSADLLRTRLMFAGIPVSKLRATRYSSDHGQLDLFNPEEYPERDDD